MHDILENSVCSISRIKVGFQLIDTTRLVTPKQAAANITANTTATGPQDSFLSPASPGLHIVEDEEPADPTVAPSQQAAVVNEGGWPYLVVMVVTYTNMTSLLWLV